MSILTKRASRERHHHNSHISNSEVVGNPKKKKISNASTEQKSLPAAVIRDYYHNSELADELIYICENATENDPPLIFLWKNVDRFVTAIPNVVGINPPFQIAPNPSVSQFKAALLNYVRVPTSPPPVQEGAITCTVLEFSQTIANLARIETNDWFLAVANADPTAVPIAAIMAPIPRTNRIGDALTSPPGGVLFWG
jgi:hypothetical protein